MDNLLAHKNNMVIQLIVGWGHRFCFRAPYYPVAGAVKYYFNTLQHDLQIKLPNICTGDDLINEVHNSIGAVVNFVNHFRDLGM